MSVLKRSGLLEGWFQVRTAALAVRRKSRNSGSALDRGLRSIGMRFTRQPGSSAEILYPLRITPCPETMTATFEEFSPAHDFFDYTGDAR